MKRTLILISVLSLTFLTEEMMSAQSKDDGNTPVKLGAGIDLEIIDRDNYPVVPPTHIIFNLDVANILRIEPGIGYKATNEDYNDMDVIDVSKRSSYSLGTYWLIKYDKTIPYLGLNLNYTKTTVDFEDANHSSQSISKESRIGPVLGIEYQFHERFSIGGEFLFLHTRKNASSISGIQESESLDIGWKTGNRLKFRFYF